MLALLQLAQATTENLGQLTGLGSAGIMGAMWLWERKNSRDREQQLDDAHTRIMSDKIQLDELIHVVQQNTEAITRVNSMQEQLLRQIGNPNQNVKT